MTRWPLIVAVAVLAFGAWVFAVRASPTPASNRAAARADAAALLKRLALPPGATASPTEPAGDGGQLATPAIGPPATPNAVDRHAWWRIPGPPGATIAYIRAHPPAGSHPSVSGKGLVGFEWPPRSGVLSNRSLIVQAVALADGATGVRADAEVVWITPRPARERIPARERRLHVTVRQTAGPHPPQPRTRDVTARRRVRRVVKLLNALPAAQPGALSCPMDRGVRVRLVFRPRRAVAVVDPSGCETVTLTVHGRRQPPLAGSPKLIRQLARALGVRPPFLTS